MQIERERRFSYVSEGKDVRGDRAERRSPIRRPIRLLGEKLERV